MRRIIAIVLLFIPTYVFAWGNAGHKIVADVAQRKLESGSAKEKKALQNALQILGAQRLADVALDPDSWKKDVLGAIHTADWHFVDIPLNENSFDPARDCKRSDCIIPRIEQMSDVLANPKASPNARKEALTFLIHFLGDIHQPLHCAEGMVHGKPDQGGNLINVTFNGGHVPGNDNGDAKLDNLHFVWDVSIIKRTGLGNAQIVAHLFTDVLPHQSASALAGGKVLDWALESHGVAKSAGVQVADHTNLGDNYMTSNSAKVEIQLLRGGFRLAKVIEDALGSQ